MSHSEQDRTPVQAALELYAGLRDSRPSDIAALTTPDALCRPLVRPGLTLYFLGEQTEISDAESGMAQTLITSMTREFRPEQYRAFPSRGRRHSA